MEGEKKGRLALGALVTSDIRIRGHARCPLLERRFKHVSPILSRQVDQLGFDAAEVFATDPPDVVPVAFPLAPTRAGLLVECVPVAHKDGSDVVPLLEEKSSCDAAVDSARHARKDGRPGGRRSAFRGR